MVSTLTCTWRGCTAFERLGQASPVHSSASVCGNRQLLYLRWNKILIFWNAPWLHSPRDRTLTRAFLPSEHPKIHQCTCSVSNYPGMRRNLQFSLTLIPVHSISVHIKYTHSCCRAFNPKSNLDWLYPHSGCLFFVQLNTEASAFIPLH